MTIKALPLIVCEPALDLSFLSFSFDPFGARLPLNVSVVRAVLSVVLLCLSCSPASGQTASAAHSRKNNPSLHPKKPETDPNAEFERRTAAARAAVQSGDPAAIRAASANVIAFSLRELAQVRAVERAYPQAIELYKQSLNFEELPDARLSLAKAYLHAKMPANAIEESEKVAFTNSASADAWKIQGQAWLQQDNYRNAAASFARALKLSGDVETAYSLAICFLNLHEPDKAKLVFQDMVKNYGDGGALHVLFGRAYRDVNDLTSATVEFRRALALDPKTPHAHYFLGLLLLIQKEWGPPTPEILGLIHEELKRDPKDFLANYLLGLLASREKDYPTASKYLEIAISISPSWPDPWLILGQDDYDQHNYPRAEEELRKAVELTGTDESRNNYQIRKGYIDLARILQAAGKKEESERYFQKARDLQHRNLELSEQAVANVVSSAGGVAGMGAVMPLSERQAEDAVAPDLASVDPTAEVDSGMLQRANLSAAEKQQLGVEEHVLRVALGASFNDLGTSLAQQGEFSDALRNFQQAEKWNPDIPGLERNLGVAAFRIKDYAEASRALARTADATPQDSAVRAMLGLSQYFNAQYPEAARTISGLGDAAAADPGLTYAWAESLIKTGDMTQATTILSRLEERSSAPDVLVLIGQSWMEMTNYDRAVQTFRRALQLSPQEPRAHFGAGLALLRNAKPAEAAAEFQAELAINPADNEAKYNLAYAYLQQADPKKALPLLQEVIAANPANADAQYQMGKLLLDDNNAGGALTYLENAARLAPEKDYIHYQLQSAYRKMARTQDADRELELYKETKSRNREKTAPHPEQNR